MSGGQFAPQRTDFSTKAVNRAVLGQTAQQPHVLYPLAVGLLGGLAAAVLGPSSLFLIPAIAGTVLGVGGWALDATLRRDHHAAEYLRTMHAQLAHRAEASVKALQRDLATAGSDEGSSQLVRLRDKYRSFEGLLRRKLDTNEITYGRYLGMAEQVYLAGLDNLSRLVDTLQGMGAIDADYLRQRILSLRSQGEAVSVQAELQALEERLALFKRQQARVKALLGENEAAMTQIDQVMAAVAETDTSAPRARLDMESAMRELKVLADRAREYSRTNRG